MLRRNCMIQRIKIFGCFCFAGAEVDVALGVAVVVPVVVPVAATVPVAVCVPAVAETVAVAAVFCWFFLTICVLK